MGAARPTTDTASQYITADKPEVTATYTSQEVTTSVHSTLYTQTLLVHTGSQLGHISSAGRSATSSDISNAEASMPAPFYCGDVPITDWAAHAHDSIPDTAFVPLSALARDAPALVGEGAVDVKK